MAANTLRRKYISQKRLRKHLPTGIKILQTMSSSDYLQKKREEINKYILHTRVMSLKKIYYIKSNSPEKASMNVHLLPSVLNIPRSFLRLFVKIISLTVGRENRRPTRS